MERTISGMMGKGSVSHNIRAFAAKNVDKERSIENLEFRHMDIKYVYHRLFDEAVETYNAKQKRKDRKIEDYYEKIRQGKQEKLFHEVIFQIGNKNDMNVRSGEGQLAKEILAEFMEEFQDRNPHLFTFSSHLHMDEETPHLHIDFVPFICDSKRGLDTRVSLKGALAAQGFHGGTRGATEWNQWIESEKQELAKVAARYGVQWKQLGTHNKHLSVLDYQKQERQKEVQVLSSKIGKSMEKLEQAEELVDSRLAKAEKLAEMEVVIRNENTWLQDENSALQREKTNLNNEIEKLKEARVNEQTDLQFVLLKKDTVERSVKVYDENPEWLLAEPGAFMSAKNYCDTKAQPLVKRLIAKLKELTARYWDKCIDLERLLEQVGNLKEQVEYLKLRLWEKSQEVEQLKEKASDLERVRKYAGNHKVQGIIDNIKEAERLEQEQQRLNRSRYGGRSR